MIYLLNWRLWLLAGLLALGPIGYVKGRIDGKRITKAEWVASVAAANAESLRLERARQSAVDSAGKLAAARSLGIAADAARARGAVVGLRGDLDALQRASAESLATANNAVRALGDVFEQCSRRYSELALEADRAASEALNLRQAWPQ